MTSEISEAGASTAASTRSPLRLIYPSKYAIGSVQSAITARARAIGGYSLATIKDPGILVGRKRYILLLSHGRCYTSLIAHIFGSHPEIIGACETYLPLRNARDLIKLRYVTYWLNNRKTGAKYIFDKILLPAIPVSNSVLNRDDVTVLFSLRHPERTIPSYSSLIHDPQLYRQPSVAGDLYIKRLQSLEHHCLALERKPLYFDANDLILRTSDLLQALRRELGLNQDLSEHYQILEHTGNPRRGDPSERIKAGCIDRNQSDYRDIVVPDELMERACAAYEHCRSLLRERSICL